MQRRLEAVAANATATVVTAAQVLAEQGSVRSERRLRARRASRAPLQRAELFCQQLHLQPVGSREPLCQHNTAVWEN